MTPGRALHGVIYVATGADYLDLAVQSARSLRAVEPEVPIDLFTDRREDVPGGLFDQVHGISNPHRRSKLECMARTRFDRTLYLDCDTLVTAPPGDLFDLLERFEMALAHDVRRASDLIRQGHEHATPYAFPQLNSGVVLYRRSERVLAFLTEWARRFAEAGVTRDQLILKDMLWQSDMRFYVLPPEFNLRRLTVLDAWEPEDAIPTIIHSHRLMDHMRGQGERLRGLERIVEAERAALDREWERAGGRDTDLVARFIGRKANR
ncbi:glycosyltransferase family protein [Marimonas lutisalis]|uniref:putative nucleotide-diphospho-sugar transferase n=1 Tax=Marimonas lutisalis TaxID=2545756 RepID=UPI0010F5C4DE|nr:putative nucleotide-diphospho-sugar transferase [Marimonas lutisalis]